MKTISEIKQRAWDALFEKSWFGPIIVTVFILMLTVAVNFFFMFMGTNNFIVTMAIDIIMIVCVLQPFSMGHKIYMLNIVRGEDASVGNMFDGYAFALKLLPQAILNMVISYLLAFGMNFVFAGIQSNPLYIIVGILLLLVYLLVAAVINLSCYLVYDEGGNSFKCLVKVLVFFLKGNIIKYIGLHLSFILWYLAAIVTFGTITFFVMPYVEASVASYYDEVRLFIKQ